MVKNRFLAILRNIIMFQVSLIKNLHYFILTKIGNSLDDNFKDYSYQERHELRIHGPIDYEELFYDTLYSLPVNDRLRGLE